MAVNPRLRLAGCAPHLDAPGRDGSSRPLQAGGPGCQEPPEPAGPSRRPSQAGCRAAAVLTGGGAAGPGVRGPRERGAEPVAAAVERQDEWVGWEVNSALALTTLSSRPNCLCITADGGCQHADPAHSLSVGKIIYPSADVQCGYHLVEN